MFAALSCSLLPAQTLNEGFEGEDPDYIAPEQQAIDQPTSASSSLKGRANKILRDGQLYIVRPDGAIYNATGVRVK